MDNNDSKGAYSRSPIFKGGSYAYWKNNMYVHLMSVEKHSLGSNHRQTFYSHKRSRWCCETPKRLTI